MKSLINSARASFGRIGGIVSCALVFTLAPAVAQADLPKILTVAVPPEGSSGYIVATGYSNPITAHTPVQKVILQPQSSSASWPATMNRGQVDLAQHCGFEQVRAAYHGEGIFSSAGKLKNIRNVATNYGLPWGIHVVDPTVASLKQLKGKAIYVQVSHSDHVAALRALFKHAGLEYGKDITVLPFHSPQEAVQGLITGRGDAVAFGLIPQLAEVQRARGLHTLDLPVDAVRQVHEASPVWGDVTIKAGFGPLAPASALDLLELECGVAAGTHLSSDAVYTIMKAIYSNLDSWNSVSPLAKQMTHQKATEVFVAPFHDGAVRYYKEQGLWNDALEKKQAALLKAAN